MRSLATFENAYRLAGVMADRTAHAHVIIATNEPEQPHRVEQADGQPDAIALVVVDGIGHNGGPSSAVLPYDAACRHCRHWKPPSPRIEAEYEAYQSGIRRRPIKQPTGYCHNVLHRPGGPVSASGTLGRSACFYYDSKFV